jgi:hypothetical protein
LRYEEWEDDEGIVLVPDDKRKDRLLGVALPRGGRLVWSIEAENWDDACRAQFQRRGWWGAANGAGRWG